MAIYHPNCSAQEKNFVHARYIDVKELKREEVWQSEAE